MQHIGNQDESQHRALLNQLVNREPRAIDLLSKLFGKRIFLYALQLVDSEAIAEEVQNDVLLEVWHNAAEFRGSSKVSTWILGITRNLALNKVRRKQLTTVKFDELTGIGEVPPGADIEFAHQHSRELSARIRSGVNSLRPEHREVIELAYYQGHSCRDIASIIGCCAPTVRTRMFYARKELSDALAPLQAMLAEA